MANVIRHKRGTSDPSVSDFSDTGELLVNTTDGGLFTKDDSGNVVEIGSGGGGGGISDVVADTTPQLGGALDVQAQEINTSTSNGNIKLAPNGTGVLEVKGNTNAGTIQLNCESNSHGVKIKGPPHSASASYTLTLPNDDGSPNQVLKTDGSGGLSWVDQSTYTHPNHSGEVTSTGDGATVIEDNVVDEANLKVSNAPTDGYFLQAQSGNTGGLTWAAASGGSGSSTLAGLTDVTISSASNGQVLKYNGSEWINDTDATGSGGGGGGSTDLLEIMLFT